MELGLAGKRALITGGSRGIGLATALTLAEEGMDLVLVARDPATLEAAAGAVRERRQVVMTTISADLSSEAEVVRVAEACGPVDVLVNNAGAIPPGGLAAVDNATWRRAWDLKVYGFISLCRQLYPAMAARGGGVIVNVIGAAGEKFPPGYIAGAAGNAALMAFTRALGHASQQDNIRVVGINPGSTATERMEMLQRFRAREEFGDEARWTDYAARAPFGRFGRPDEIAAAVAFLASPRSGYTTGTILTIDGGA